MTLSNMRGLVTSLNNQTLSNFEREEVLFTLIKEVLFTEVKDTLKECLFSEDYKLAYDIADNHMTLLENKHNIVKTVYDKKQLHSTYRTHKRTGEFFSFVEDISLSTSHEIYNHDVLDLVEDIQETNMQFKKVIKQRVRKTNKGDIIENYIAFEDITNYKNNDYKGFDTTWNKAIRKLERVEAFDLYSLENKERISKLRKILKRKARLSNNKLIHSKNGRVTKYKKRDKVILPSQK